MTTGSGSDPRDDGTGTLEPPTETLDWGPLLAWAAREPGAEGFGGWTETTRDDGTTSLGWARLSPHGEAFLQACRDTQVVAPFDWPRWKDGPGARYGPDRSAIDTASLEDCRRLLTVLVRQDRFVEGLLLGALDDGLVHRILRRVAVLVGDDAGTTGTPDGGTGAIADPEDPPAG